MMTAVGALAVAAAGYGGYTLAGGNSRSDRSAAIAGSPSPSVPVPDDSIAPVDASAEPGTPAASPVTSDVGATADLAQVCADHVVSRMARYYETFGSTVTERSTEAYRLIIRDLAPRSGAAEFWPIAYLSRTGRGDAGVSVFPEPGFYIPAVLEDLGPARMLAAVRPDLVLTCRNHSLLPDDNRLARLWERSSGCNTRDCSQTEPPSPQPGDGGSGDSPPAESPPPGEPPPSEAPPPSEQPPPP